MDNMKQGEKLFEEPEEEISWKKNYIFVWLSQFLSLMGFTFALPFAPLYIQTLGVKNPDEVLFWTGIYTAAAPLGLAVMSPIWGVISDKYGRRVMMLRANFCGGIVLFSMGLVSSVGWLVALRILQGIFTGTVSAAVTMVAVSTPKHRQGFAIGALSAAVFCGQLFGSAVGGYVADWAGYANCFKLAGLITGLSFFIILFGVRENFKKPEKSTRVSQRKFFKVPKIGFAMPILLLFSITSFALMFDRSILPLFVQELLDGKIEGTATKIGQLTAFCSVSLILSGVLSGHIVDKTSPQLAIKIAAGGAALFVFLHTFVTDLSSLFILRPLMFLFAGMLNPALQVWLMKHTPEEKKGQLTGWSVTARSVSWIIAPLISTNLAVVLGLRPIFAICSLVLLSLIPTIIWTTKKVDSLKN